MDDTPLDYREEINMVFSLVGALRQAQEAILERPWLKPMFASVLPENGITERTFNEFTAEGIKELSAHALQPSEEDAESN